MTRPPIRAKPRSSHLKTRHPWALRDSNPRPLRCKGRLAQASNQHVRRSRVVQRVTGIPSCTTWFSRLLDQMLTTEARGGPNGMLSVEAPTCRPRQRPELPVGLSADGLRGALSADRDGLAERARKRAREQQAPLEPSRDPVCRRSPRPDRSTSGSRSNHSVPQGPEETTATSATTPAAFLRRECAPPPAASAARAGGSVPRGCARSPRRGSRAPAATRSALPRVLG
jgi:hypothetical protein